MVRRHAGTALAAAVVVPMLLIGVLAPQARTAPGGGSTSVADASALHGRGAAGAVRSRSAAVARLLPPTAALTRHLATGAGAATATAISADVVPTLPPGAGPTAAPSSAPAPTPAPTAAAAAAAPAAAAPAPAAAGPDCAVLRCLALTFDDGPGPYTAQLLDELAARHVPATFFLVGTNVVKHPDLVAREVAAGHAVGNHSWSHPELTTLSADQVAAQLDQTAAAIEQAAGVTTTLMRPPYGAIDATVQAVLASRGDAAILWSADTQDWKNRNVGQTTARALAGATPGGIVLMHDIHPTTVTAVPGIVDALRAAGYTLVTVPQLLGTTTPGQRYTHR